jgi:hypothetical protein
MEDPQIIVTLVHGTFARDAAWTNADSPLCMELASRFGQDVTIRKFQWSGRNRFRDRHEASLKLAEEILANHRKRPDCKQVVIGHSHGGNIISYLHRESAQLLHAAVCMATPFIMHNRTEEEDWFTYSAHIISTILGLLAGFMLMCRVYYPQMPYVLSLNPLDTWYISDGFSANRQYVADQGGEVRLAIASLLCVVVANLLTATYLAICRARAVALESLIPDRIHLAGHRILIVRSVSDEASFVISVSHFMQRMASSIREWLLVLSLGFLYIIVSIVGSILDEEDGNRSLILYALIALAIAAYPILLLWNLYHGEGLFAVIGSLIQIVAGLLLLVIYLFAFFISCILYFALASAVIFWPAVVLSSLLALTVGRELVLAMPLFQLSVEGTPAGTYKVLQLDYRQSNFRGASLLHSSVYASDTAIAATVDWIVAKTR